MRFIKKFMLNAALLTAVSLIMRGIGVIFNVYVSNRVGAEAMGLFSLLGSVYGFGITFATSGINLATTRMVSEAIGEGQSSHIGACMKRCFTYSVSFGGMGALLLFLSAEFIGFSLLDEPRTVLSLKILSITLPFISISSCLNGYINAVRRVYKNASVQLGEQAVKIFFTVFLLSLLLPKGIEFACLALVLGGAIAECVSCLVMLTVYYFDKGLHFPNAALACNEKAITKKLLGISLPVAFSAYARSALITIEHMLIPLGLRKSGASRERSLAAYGTLHSMVLPIVLFPSALIGSFSGLLIPELAECKARGNRTEINYITSRVFQMSLIFSIGVAGIMMCYSYELGTMIYSSEEASRYIRLLAPLIPIMYFDSTVDAMLKGLGQQVYSMNVNIIDASLSVVLVWALLPTMGIEGYITTIFITELLNASLSIVRLLNISGIKPKIIKWVAKPLACVVGSTVISKQIFPFLSDLFTGDTVKTVFMIIFSIALYIFLLCLSAAFDKEDVRWIINILKRDSKKAAKGI